MHRARNATVQVQLLLLLLLELLDNDRLLLNEQHLLLLLLLHIDHAFGKLEDHVDLRLIGVLDPCTIVSDLTRNPNDAAENGELRAGTGTCSVHIRAHGCLLLGGGRGRTLASDEVILWQDGMHESEVGVLECLLDLERAVRAFADVVEWIERVLDAQYGRAVGATATSDECGR
jgi:hypothetical protein